jgi:hypothetical protein
LPSSRADRFEAVYFRAAQAYMLISMPTGTSTIFGVFQVISSSQEFWRELHAEVESRTTPDTAQVRNIARRHLRARPDGRYFSPRQGDFPLGQNPAATDQSA